jgi:hypothetical protein
VFSRSGQDFLLVRWQCDVVVATSYLHPLTDFVSVGVSHGYGTVARVLYKAGWESGWYVAGIPSRFLRWRRQWYPCRLLQLGDIEYWHWPSCSWLGGAWLGLSALSNSCVASKR